MAPRHHIIFSSINIHTLLLFKNILVILVFKKMRGNSCFDGINHIAYLLLQKARRDEELENEDNRRERQIPEA